ncbi:MAG: NAD(P)/FAD-dependent oxidoreductase [Alphaproteobacteria bacterium]|jgi:phytoene dehydrogenase-like protein
MSPTISDIVVVGAGHNALTAAAYLARAGLSVTVLEAREMIGGGTVTEELTVPGFHHDTFSTGHPWLMTNPLLTRDELGVLENGLRYVGNDPVVVMPFKDGTSLTFWRDPHRTATELARYSKHDAGALLDLYAEWDRLAPVHMTRAVSEPGADLSALDPGLVAHYDTLREKSGWQDVHDRFESEQARALFLWFGLAVVQPVDRPGTGHLPVTVPSAWNHGWMNAVGGSSKLAEYLAADIGAHGGHIVTGARVAQIRVTGDRATGVRTEDGTEYTARRAVLSSMHFTELPRKLGTGLPDAFVEGTRSWRAGPGLIVVHLALPDNPRARGADGPVASVLVGQSSVAGVAEMLEAVAAERLPERDPYMLCACSTWIDPSRAPEGKATLKLITMAPYALGGDAANWDDAKEAYADFLIDEFTGLAEDFDPAAILGRCVHSPLDSERRNPSYYRGAAQGGEMLPDQMGLNRPLPGWANYRMPVAGLYQTGTSTHPGGPVSGWPGRHAAKAILEDLQIDWRRVMPEDAPTHPPDIPIIDTSLL